MIRKIFGILSVIFAIVIFYYSVAPVEPTGVSISNFDKIEHLGAYFLLALFIYISTKRVFLSFLISGVYGALIEIIQGLLYYRSSNVFDALANFIGAALILFIWLADR